MKKFLFFFFLSGSLCAQISPLTIRNLSGNFYIYTTYMSVNGQPFPSNSLYVLTDSGAVMIDTPWDARQTLPLLDSIEKKHHQKVRLCIVTHFHDDRTAGLEILNKAGIPTYSSLQSYQLGKDRGEKLATYQFVNDTTFVFGGLKFETFYPGAGHSPDNLVVWFPKYRILYGGCFVKSLDAFRLGNVEDADLVSWPLALKKTIRKFKSPKFVIPGHQGWTDKNAMMHTLYLLEINTK